MLAQGGRLPLRTCAYGLGTINGCLPRGGETTALRDNLAILFFSSCVLDTALPKGKGYPDDVGTLSQLVSECPAYGLLPSPTAICHFVTLAIQAICGPERKQG
jgi:hypothetical protein